MKKALCVFAIAAGTAFFSAAALAADDLAERIAARGTITVGTEGTYPPFTYHDESGRLTGYDVEVMRALGKELGVTVEFKEVPWAALLAGLNQGRFDMAANEVHSTPAREKKYAISAPYSFSGSAFAVRADEQHIRSLDDVKGKTAGIALSSIYSDRLREKGAAVEPVEGGLGQEVMLVAQGRTDFTLNDRLAVLYFKNQMKDNTVKMIELPEEPRMQAGLILRKENAAALPAIDKALETLRKNGTLAGISQQFFGEDVSAK